MVKVQNLRQLSLQPSAIRVPLDVCRPRRATRQWRALTLNENRVGANAELVEVLRDLLRLQRRVGGSLPVLVDEKVHYAVMRMMHSRMLSQLDVGGWLCQMPVLYGVWHPYKQCVTVVYRTFFPVFALLECTGRVTVGARARLNRKLLYMEKMVAALLLCAHEAIPLVMTALHGRHGEYVQGCCGRT